MKKKYFLRYGLFLLCSFLFCLLFCSSTTPLRQYYNALDSDFFTLVGQGMTKGLLPYRDFFDMKGPYMFFIEYIGQLLHYGRSGAFLPEVVNLALCLILIDLILSPKFEGNRYRWMIELSTMAFCAIIAAVTFGGGNLTEEYSLPLLLFTLLLCVKYAQRAEHTENYAHPLLYGFLYGVMTGILALIRVTNAAFIGAVVLSVGILLLCKKEFLNAVLNIVMFIGGLLAAFIPAFIYFLSKGLLGEMLRQVFGFGATYSANASFISKLSLLGQFWQYGIVLLLPLVILIVYRNKNPLFWLLGLTNCLLTVFAFSLGYSYLHYYTLTIPGVVLGIYFLPDSVENGKGSKYRRCIVLAVILCIMVTQLPNIKPRVGGALTDVLYAVRGNEPTGEYDLVNDIKKEIPEEEQDKVYVYGLLSCSNWYAQAGLFPCNRYCDWQEWYVLMDTKVEGELTAYFENDPPSWVVVGTEEEYDGTIGGVIAEKYTEYYKNEKYVLLRAK